MRVGEDLTLTTAQPFVLKISYLGACRGKTQESKKYE